VFPARGKEIFFFLRSVQTGPGSDSVRAVGRCPGYEADWAPPLYNRRIMGGAVSTAASSCIAVGLTERHNGSYSFTVPGLCI
jgi:hypothetical protein